MTYENKLLLETREAAPTTFVDSVQGYARGLKNGEQVAATLGIDVHSLEGRRFTATTVLTTGATGVAGHPAPVIFEDVKPYLYVKNNNTVASGIKMHLDRITLRYTAIGAGGTLPRWWSAIEPNGTNRYTSGGTQITALPNTRGGSSVTSNAVIYQGAVVAPAASTNVRKIKGGQIRPVIPVIYDEVNFAFGVKVGQYGVLSGTLVATQTIPHPAVTLDPGDQFLLSLWRASQSGADSLELDMDWVER
jgi:hypothetical protein